MQEAVARAAIAAGLPDGPFTGVPFLLKDLGCEAIDFPTRMGSRLYDGYRYDYDSELFVRLRAAGLVHVRPHHQPEFGIGADHRGEGVRPTDAQPVEHATTSPAGPAAGRVRRSPPAWCRSRTAATAAARCASLRRRAGCSA